MSSPVFWKVSSLSASLADEEEQPRTDRGRTTLPLAKTRISWILTRQNQPIIPQTKEICKKLDSGMLEVVYELHLPTGIEFGSLSISKFASDGLGKEQDRIYFHFKVNA